MDGRGRLSRAWLARVCLLGLALLTVAACGVKTAPYPAADTLPGPVENLRQVQTESGEALLSWDPPSNNMAGHPLKSLGGFKIEMADNILDDNYCESCPHRYQSVDSVSAAPPPPGLTLAPGPYQWRRPLSQGHIYHFRVAGYSKSGGLHPQAWTTAVVRALPEPGRLSAFAAALGDKAVVLTWPKPRPGFALEVEKQDAEGRWRKLPDLDPAAGRYEDLAVEYGQTPRYRARQSAISGQSVAPGPWSPELAILVKDVTPPPTPLYVDAGLAADGARLSWEGVAYEPDFAGYRLERRVNDGPWRRVGPALIRENTWQDRDVADLKAGDTLYYRVTALDQSGNASGPSPEAEVAFEPVPNPESPRELPGSLPSN